MTYIIIMTEHSKSDLINIETYISETLHEPVFGKNTIEGILKQVFSLSILPKRNPVIEEIGFINREIRKILAGNFIIFYLVVDERQTVVILRVIYKKREWENLL
ncbi:MAG: type II toxin-antitoxin system RelE/ParE family toxin [Bacillota bacterium]